MTQPCGTFAITHPCDVVVLAQCFVFDLYLHPSWRLQQDVSPAIEVDCSVHPAGSARLRCKEDHKTD